MSTATSSTTFWRNIQEAARSEDQRALTLNSTSHTQYLAANKTELPLELPGRSRPLMPDDLGAETGG